MQQHGQGGGAGAKTARVEQMKRAWQSKKKISDHLGSIKTKIGVYSGKGGVGKSTIAVNLAVLLAEGGAAVGLLDADIDCPNVLKLLKVDEQPSMVDGRIYPAEMHGVKVVSMGSFQENEEEAVIFRGPMIHNALTQFFELTEWGELDYLLLDMPPGTSDAALTVMQTLQLDGFVVVTTPQEMAVLDAKRSISMIKKLNVPVLGVVENMTGDFFGMGGGEVLAKDVGTKFLGSIALSQSFRTPDRPVVLLDQEVRKEFETVLEGMRLAIATP